MNKWEYMRVTDTEPMSMLRLSTYGINGWEMCGLHVSKNDTHTYYFKRHKLAGSEYDV